ncbi:MAG: hypothetical protein LBK60_01910 [Verrucomicrobiales bacterium]|jgi:hypothetical protein|nr:hypothetical protein [Verrucomicrobiales bacterium]
MEKSKVSHEGTRIRGKNCLIGKILVIPWLRVSLLLLGFTISGWCAEVPRVAISVSGSDGERWQSVLTTELGKVAEFQVVERAEFARVLREREELALRGDADGGRPLPPLPVITYYLHFRESSVGNWLVEIVAADRGTLLASGQVKDVWLADAARLAEVTRGLFKNIAGKTFARHTPRVAIIEPTGGLANDQVFILATRLRDALTVSGFIVLDRALTQEIVIGRNEAERGMRDAIPNNSFLGADYFLQLAPADGDHCELRLVNAADGQLVASKDFSGASVSVVNQIQSWLFPLFGTPEKNVQPYLPSVSVEALQPFYRGLKLYDEGKFAEATNEFSRAYMLDRQFREAYEWEARCYDALALTPLGDAMRRYARVFFDYSVSTNSDAPTVSDAVAFLGVSGAAPELCARLSVLTADVLNSLPGQKICLPENPAQICREYDWLTGLSDADGPRWEQAPSFFNRTTISDGRSVVRWFLRDTLNGTLTASAELPLLVKPGEWRGQIEKFLRGWDGT